jgi:hypothetical protein
MMRADGGRMQRSALGLSLLVTLISGCAVSHGVAGDAGADGSACGAAAEPDPVCWCGREPRAGDPCAEEGLGCGACCPTPEGPNWPYMVCSGGRWAPGGCPDVECPLLPCPADTASVLGAPCITGQACGDSCCDTAIVCEEGRWAPGPVADCAACRSFPCGPGSCRDDQFCRVGCGPADGLEFTCEDAGGCRDCSCVPVPPGATCEIVDGHPLVRGPLGCG